MGFVQTIRPEAAAGNRKIKGVNSYIATEFSSNGKQVRWLHQIAYDPETVHQKHPVAGAYTTELIDTHARMLNAATALQSGPKPAGGEERVSLSLTLDEKTRSDLDRIHHKADWVILMDRYLGIDLFDDPEDPFLSAVSRKYLLDYAPEFIDGLGHRLVVTTMWREEVEDILSRAMNDLGFSVVEESVGEALQQLKSVSGRLALRLIRDNSRAKEAASLGVVVAWLRATGGIANSILVPVDAHPEIFAAGEPRTSRKDESGVLNRCDLIQIRFGGRRKVEASFIEVKSRQSQVNYTGLADRMCDQMESTENQFRSLFFQPERRIDHVLQRSKLAGILRFYALRGKRYGFIESSSALKEILLAIDGLESGYPHLRTTRAGFVVDLSGKKQKPFSHRGASIRVLSAADFAGETPFRVSEPPEAVESEIVDVASPVIQADIGPSLSEESEDPTSFQENAARADASGPEEVLVGLGQTDQGNEVQWRASVKGSPHLFVLGIPGQGKSWITTRLLLEMHKQELPAIILDFHGQFSMPGSVYVDRIRPTIWDATKGLPFSPFETAAGSDDWKANCFAVSEIFQYVFQLGDIQRGVIYDAMRDCYLESGANDDPTAPLPRLADLEKKIRDYESQTGARNTLIRCKPIFEFNMFDENRAATTTDLLAVTRKGLVIDLHRMSMETTQMAAGAFVLRKIYKDMFRWGECNHLRLAIVLDEAHRICKDTTLPKIMKEGRKFGIAVIAATQQLDDFHPDVLGNAGTKIVFRTNHPASRKVAGFLRVHKGIDVVDTVEQLAVGTAMVQTPEMREAEIVNLYAIPSVTP